MNDRIDGTVRATNTDNRPHGNAPECPACDTDVFVTGVRGTHAGSSRSFAPKWQCQFCGEMWGHK